MTAAMPEVWIVPPHANTNLPVVLCPEQEECLRIAKSVRVLLDHYEDDIKRMRNVAALHTVGVLNEIAAALFDPTRRFHEAMTGVESEVCQRCGKIADADCRCEEF